jgi:hypothetical protein
LTTLQSSPKALSNEEAKQKLMRMRMEANAQHKSALRRNQKKLIEREPWLQEAIQEIVVYTARRRKLEERGILPKRTNDTTEGAWTGVNAAKEAKGRLLAQGTPLAGKTEARDDRPTPERMGKGDLTNKSGRKGSNPANPDEAPDIDHQTRDPLENVYKHLTDRESAALARLITNMEYARKVRSITANYEGTNGGGFGPRHGGLPDDVREAATVADWMLDKMHPQFQKLAKALAYGVQRDLDGRPLTKHEIMSLFFPDMGDKGRKDGGWIALCRSLSWRTIEREWELDDAINGETKGGANRVRQIAREQT